MKKTFWSVTYEIYGVYHTRTMWFRTKEDAEKYAGEEHGRPIRHTYSNPATIAYLDRLIDYEGGEQA